MQTAGTVFNNLQATLMEIKRQKNEVQLTAMRQDIEPHKMVTQSGEFVLNSLLLAEANCLNGMAVLIALKETKRHG